LHVAGPLGGVSLVLTVNHQSVLTDQLAALTDGTPPPIKISAIANQAILSAS
jgi:hypothetical protein